jgi:hypothetical protein
VNLYLLFRKNTATVTLKTLRDAVKDLSAEASLLPGIFYPYISGIYFVKPQEDFD